MLSKLLVSQPTVALVQLSDVPLSTNLLNHAYLQDLNMAEVQKSVDKQSHIFEQHFHDHPQHDDPTPVEDPEDPTPPIQPVDTSKYGPTQVKLNQEKKPKEKLDDALENDNDSKADTIAMTLDALQKTIQAKQKLQVQLELPDDLKVLMAIQRQLIALLIQSQIQGNTAVTKVLNQQLGQVHKAIDAKVATSTHKHSQDWALRMMLDEEKVIEEKLKDAKQDDDVFQVKVHQRQLAEVREQVDKHIKELYFGNYSLQNLDALTENAVVSPAGLITVTVPKDTKNLNQKATDNFNAGQKHPYQHRFAVSAQSDSVKQNYNMVKKDIPLKSGVWYTIRRSNNPNGHSIDQVVEVNADKKESLAGMRQQVVRKLQLQNMVEAPIAGNLYLI